MRFTVLATTLLAAFGSSLTAQSLIAIDSSRALSSVNPATGAKSLLGTVSANAGTTGALAYDPATDTVYLSSTSLDSLFTLNVATLTATLVGAYGDSTVVMHGLEWDSSTNTLYGASNDDLYTINTTTGVATLVGSSLLAGFTNLGYDSANDVMLATGTSTDAVYTINRATGAATLLNTPVAGTLSNPHGLAFDCVTRTMYLVDSATDNFYTINTTTGAVTLVGAMGTGNLLGLVYIGCRAAWSQFGSSCTGSAGAPTLTSASRPVAGLNFTSNVTNLPSGAPTFGVIGFSNTLLSGALPLPVDLVILGAPSCFINIDIVVTVPLVETGGTAPFTLSLPLNALGLVVYEQAYVVDPPANAFGLTSTNGGSATIGF